MRALAKRLIAPNLRHALRAQANHLRQRGVGDLVRWNHLLIDAAVRERFGARPLPDARRTGGDVGQTLRHRVRVRIRLFAQRNHRRRVGGDCRPRHVRVHRVHPSALGPHRFPPDSRRPRRLAPLARVCRGLLPHPQREPVLRRHDSVPAGRISGAVLESDSRLRPAARRFADLSLHDGARRWSADAFARARACATWAER